MWPWFCHSLVSPAPGQVHQLGRRGCGLSSGLRFGGAADGGQLARKAWASPEPLNLGQSGPRTGHAPLAEPLGWLPGLLFGAGVVCRSLTPEFVAASAGGSGPSQRPHEGPRGLREAEAHLALAAGRVHLAGLGPLHVPASSIALGKKPRSTTASVRALRSQGVLLEAQQGAPPLPHAHPPPPRSQRSALHFSGNCLWSPWLPLRRLTPCSGT